MSKPTWITVGQTFLGHLYGHDVEIVQTSFAFLEQAIAANPDASCLWSMNTTGDGIPLQIKGAAVARAKGLPSVWVTCEDPNGLAGFIEQAIHFDHVFTSDRECIPAYKQRGKTSVHWLPLAAQPALHYPADLVAEPADFVLLANHYPYDAKVMALERLILPIVRAGFSLALYSYENSPWPAPVQLHWRAATSCFDCAKFYPEGRIALGSNCQMRDTTMTSMRTYEALACGKPFLNYYSSAYQALGFMNGRHFMWISTVDEAIGAANMLLNDSERAAMMAHEGREFVLRHHTYEHRVAYIEHVLAGGKDELDFAGGT